MTGHYDRDLTIAALQGALPYIRLFRNRIFVVKAGGALCGDPTALRDVAGQLSVLRELGIKVVLVHGGGPQTTELSKKLGLETSFIEGRRVTSEKTLEVAVMTLNGSVNTAILSACRSANLPAVGLSGLDAGLVRARRRTTTPVDYGLVGDIVSVDASVVLRLLEGGFLPVISPLSADDSGQVLNVNADTVASTLARELKAEKLILLTDTPGLLEDRNNPGSLISYTDVRGLDALQAKGAIDAGMLPKVKAAVESLQGGVNRVHMVGYKARANLLIEVFTNEGAGTLIVRDTSELAPSEASPPPPAVAGVVVG
ncbi:MAG: acetylglutamate kinase [Myxococcaceae bacterium]